MVMIGLDPPDITGLPAWFFAGISLILISIATLAFVAAASPTVRRTTTIGNVVAIVLQLVIAVLFFGLGSVMLFSSSPYLAVASISDWIIGAGLVTYAGSLIPLVGNAQARVAPVPVVSALIMHVVSMLLMAGTFDFPPVSIWLLILAAATIVIVVAQPADRVGGTDSA